MTTTTTRAASVSPGVAAVLDIVLVVVFAGLGRWSHGESPTGALATAWPFLVGAATGWAIWYAVRRSAPTTLLAGLVVWPATVVGGMVLRTLTGQGTALTFVLVSLAVTGIFLLGWRGLAAMRARRA